ncbi:unnamed protein product, partial [Timema podura]|nr:unnamed protein product [Timema podura]
ILPNDAKARRLFVTTGSLKRVQEIKAEPGSTLMEYITIINCCFPEDIIRYYSPGYPETLLDRVEQYQPELQDMALNEERRNSSEIPDLTLHLHDNGKLTIPSVVVKLSLSSHKCNPKDGVSDKVRNTLGCVRADLGVLPSPTLLDVNCANQETQKRPFKLCGAPRPPLAARHITCCKDESKTFFLKF